MCKLESCPVVPMASEELITLDVVDGVEGVLEEVLTDQVKQQLWECGVWYRVPETRCACYVPIKTP